MSAASAASRAGCHQRWGVSEAVDLDSYDEVAHGLTDRVVVAVADGVDVDDVSIEEAGQDLTHGRLAGARRADERDRLHTASLSPSLGLQPALGERELRPVVMAVVLRSHRPAGTSSGTAARGEMPGCPTSSTIGSILV